MKSFFSLLFSMFDKLSGLAIRNNSAFKTQIDGHKKSPHEESYPYDYLSVTFALRTTLPSLAGW